MSERMLLISILVLTAVGCAPQNAVVPSKEPLVVRFLYPTEDSSLEMGQTLKTIVQVQGEHGEVVKDAEVTLTLRDPSGTIRGNSAAVFGLGDVYRSEAWTIPHRLEDGPWTATVRAATRTGEGTASTRFAVRNSLSEKLLQKYGFWIDNPTLKGIETNLVKEEGDAQNGVIIWGGVLPTQHIFTESWLEVQWRDGDFKLTSPEHVRAFMLGALGNGGFTPVRDIGPFERVKFKEWDAWQASVRGQFLRYDGQWLIFYAPEVNKTFGIGTTVVQAPTGIDPHERLRGSFEVHPEVHANGVAPESLPHLLPAPVLTAPEMGTRFTGNAPPVVLTWKPLRELAPDEYYRVRIDFNYDEANLVVNYATRETEFTIPAALYDRPNCGVFNWEVTLMRQTGMDADGKPMGELLSYDSLYWYVRWIHPPDKATPFPPLCPNPQY